MNDAIFGLAWIQFWLFRGLVILAFAFTLWALVDCLVRPARAFPAAGKRTRAFWLVVTGLAALVGFLSLPLGGNPFPQFLALIAVVASIVYLVDVRPAVAPYSRRRGGGRGSSSRGGW